MKRIVILILVLGFGLCANGQIPAPGKPKEFQLPAKKIAKFDNGLASTFVQYGNIPKVNINVIIKAGNIHEGPEEVWLGDLTANLMKEGTTSFDFKTISKKVAAMGGDLSINTGFNQMTISGSVLSEFAPDLIKILADIVMNPKFPVSEFDRLKTDLKRQLIVQQDVPQNLAIAKFRSIIYKDHAYGRYFPTEKMIDGYTLDMVKGFYDKNLGAKRTVVYAVGKFNEEKVKEAIKETLGKWRAGPEVNYPVATPNKANEIAVLDRAGAPQTTVIVGIPTLDFSRPDYLPLQLTNSLLGGTFGSRITDNLREDKGYSYAPFSAINNGYRTAFWYEQADVTSENTGASIEVITEEIERLQKEAPPEDELKGIQRYEAGIFVLQNSTRGGITSQLNLLDLHGLPDSYLTERVKNIYAVTPEKVQQMAKDYLQYKDMTIVMVGDKKQIDKQIKDMESKIRPK